MNFRSGKLSLTLSVIFLMITFTSQTDASSGERVDISAVKDKLHVFHDGKGHYLVVPSPFESSPSEYFFYGDGKVFFRQRVFGFSSDADAKRFSLGFWEPRTPGGNGARFTGEGGKYQLECANRLTHFTALPFAQAESLIQHASFHEVKWAYQSFALALDDDGVYYYVDRGRNLDRPNFRIFVGQRGGVRPVPMKSMRINEKESVFATKEGELRLAVNEEGASWQAKKKLNRLAVLSVEEKADFIYGELGAYSRQQLGTPCDDL